MPAATTNKPGESGYALFDTAIGRCALVWRGGLVIGAALPEASDERARLSLARRFPGAAEAGPPPFAARAIERIAGLLAGARTDLGDIDLDLSAGSEFERRVWEAARRIPCGEVRQLRRHRSRDRRTAGRPGGRNRARPQPGPDHRPLPPGPGRRRPQRRLLGAGRSGDQVSDPRDRRSARPGEPELFESLPLAVKPDGRRQ
jgi:methylated-DNA-[protein]-cysteine S-methyltransferase